MADSAYEEDNRAAAGEAIDDEYTSRTGQKEASVPVQSDADDVEDPIDPDTADSDEQLEKDDADAVDKSNIIEERTRGAAPKKGAYREPGDEEGIPS